MNAIELANECRETMDAEVLRAWAKDAVAMLRAQHSALEPVAKVAGAVFRVDEDGRMMNASRPHNQTVWGFDRAELTYGDLRRASRVYGGQVDEA